jgi:subtilisin
MPSARNRRQAAGGSGEAQPGQGSVSWSPDDPNRHFGTTDGYTGRYLVLFREGAGAAALHTIADAASVEVVNTADFEDGALAADALSTAEAMYFDKLGVAVVQPGVQERLQAGRIRATAETGILVIEPEREVHIFEAAVLSGGVDDLVDNLLTDGAGAATATGVGTAAADESVLTWGLQVTGVAASQYTGKGVRLCLLDTGYTATHPDFVNRTIVSKSFVAGEDVKADGHGHGTHVLGTACGPKTPRQLPRYGIAFEADPFVGKVLSNMGSGNDAGILAGINWALTNQCQIISMSLGAATQPGQTYSRVYEAVARRALAAGALIVAAAGNESMRPSRLNPVGHPANCPSVLAVASLDQTLTASSFSNAGLNPQGGQVDLAGPGRNVISSWPNPLYRSLSGTSMATPHVAGIAALWLQANTDMGGGTLGWLLLQNAKRLTERVRDVGAGLVEAP